MTYEQIMSDIGNRRYKPIYLLTGEEPYFIDTISDALENTVLDEVQKTFNLVVLYGLDVNVHDIVNQARAFPMMGDVLLVIVKEAQNVKDIDALVDYLPVFPPTTILVLDYKYKKLDKRKSFAKQVDKMGVLFESKKLYDNKIPEWVMDYLKERKYSITHKACQMIVDFIGNDLHKIRNELEKLILALPKKKNIDDADVEYNIGISKDFNIFELQSAIGTGNLVKAVQIVNYFGDNINDNPIIVTVSVLFGYFTKLMKLHCSNDKSRSTLASLLGVSPFFVNDYLNAANRYSLSDCCRCIEVLREFDLKSKGYNNVSSSQKELYREMIFKLMHNSYSA